MKYFDIETISDARLKNYFRQFNVRGYNLYTEVNGDPSVLFVGSHKGEKVYRDKYQEMEWTLDDEDLFIEYERPYTDTVVVANVYFVDEEGMPTDALSNTYVQDVQEEVDNRLKQGWRPA